VAGDRIMKVGPAQIKQMQPFNGRVQFAQLMANFPVKMEVSFEVKRKEAEEVPPAKGYPPPDEASRLKALVAPKPLQPVGQPKVDPPLPEVDPKGKKPQDKKDPKVEEKKEEKKDERPVEVGFLKRENAAQGRKYWIYVPRNYDPNRSYGLVVWLHPADVQGRDADDVTDIWAPYLREFNMIMVGPVSKAKEGWSPSELDGILSDVQDVTGQYTIDRQRVICHGPGIGGQMAYYLGFNAREVIRGVATHAAVLATQPKDTVPSQRLQFFIVAGEKDPIVKDIQGSKPKLTEKKYPVIYREIANLGKQYIDAEEDETTLQELLRWMDTLDRQ
jgi:serine protease Do